MIISHHLSLTTSIVAASLVFLSSFPAISTIFRILSAGHKKRGKASTATKIYQDEDGVATPESQADFSQRKSKIAITVIVIAAFAINLAVTVLSTLDYDGEQFFTIIELWMHVGLWVSTFGINFGLLEAC